MSNSEQSQQQHKQTILGALRRKRFSVLSTDFRGDTDSPYCVKIIAELDAAIAAVEAWPDAPQQPNAEVMEWETEEVAPDGTFYLTPRENPGRVIHFGEVYPSAYVQGYTHGVEDALSQQPAMPD